MTRVKAFGLVAAERLRQDKLKAAGRFRFTCADDGLSLHEKNSVLAEEAGEVARAINDGDMENLKEELVQTAAVCIAFLESLS